MSVISTVGLSKSYGADDIFSSISVSIPRAARIALVGPNGIGKTTLLRVLVGLEESSAGRVNRARNLTMGYLPQEGGIDASHTLWEECLTAVSDLRAQEMELADLEAAMADPDRTAAAIKRYGALQESFERNGGYTYETRIRQILTGLGFDSSDYDRPLPQLSGGQRTRALLARLLLMAPELLVLDEPTNHLDIAATEWLENYMNQWEGAAVIVSHDRYFLDQVADTVWEMSSSRIEMYRGNYSAYVQQRRERWELRQQIYQAERARLEKELDYIKRNIASQRTQLSKGKLKRLSREVQAIESLGFEAVQGKNWAEISSKAAITVHPMSVAEVEQRIHSFKEPSNRPPRLSLGLKAARRSGDLVIRTRDLEIGYPDEGKPLFSAPDLLLKRGECAAVIGPNGAGKTTFLKTLLGQMPPLAGDVIMGASLNIGYFVQAHEDLRPERTLVQEIEAVAQNMLLADIRHHLARFLFTGDDVFKKVAVLSGGERGRLALAKLSLTGANLLLLDEPTTHLDIPSQEILQEVLADYQGTMLLVSHDRYLIDALGTRIWEIQTGQPRLGQSLPGQSLPGQPRLQVFEGSYSQYRAYLEAREIEHSGLEERKSEKAAASKTRRTSAVKLERRRRARLEEIEGLVEALEQQLEVLSRKLESPPADLAELQKLGVEYVQVQSELDESLSEWEQLNHNNT